MDQEIASWILGGIFLLFHLWAFVWGPDELPQQKHKFLALSAALLAGFLAFFLSGSIALDANPDLPQLGKTSIQAGSGFALFLIVLVWWRSAKAPISQKGLHKKLDLIIAQNEAIQAEIVKSQPPVASVQQAKNPLSEEERAAYEAHIAELKQTEREAKEKYNRELERRLDTQISYAGVLQREAKYKEAEAVYRGLMVAHSENSNILNGLFIVLYTQAKFQVAEPLISRALEIDEHSYGTTQSRVLAQSSLRRHRAVRGVLPQRTAHAQRAQPHTLSGHDARPARCHHRNGAA